MLDLKKHPRIEWSLQEITASPLPNLETLRLDNKTLENFHLLAILSPSLEKHCLRSLDLCSCLGLKFHSLDWLEKHGQNLVELRITGNTTVTDETLKEVMKFKKLRYLNLWGCTISCTGLMQVVNGSQGKLREVVFGKGFWWEHLIANEFGVFTPVD